jgi:CheY-like chemotaxis protein
VFDHLGSFASKNQAPLRFETKLYRAELSTFGRKVAVVSVSAANGALALAVLVVEDDFFVRYDIAGCLREAGYAVVETGSGEEALALCKSGMPIDMIVTDINLGGSASGWDVAKHFRLEQPDMPVVYMSGEVINPERCVPGSVVVAKPYQHIDILSACRRLHNR